MILSLLAVCYPGKNDLATGGYMDLDNPSILNYNIASCTTQILNLEENTFFQSKINNDQLYRDVEYFLD